MQNEIKMDYPLMEEMEKTFQAGREQLQETAQALQGLADRLDQGALLGQAGDAFGDAIRGALIGAVNKLADKFEELEGDLKYAVQQMKDAEQQAKSSF